MRSRAAAGLGQLVAILEHLADTKAHQIRRRQASFTRKLMQLTPRRLRQSKFKSRVHAGQRTDGRRNNNAPAAPRIRYCKQVPCTKAPIRSRSSWRSIDRRHQLDKPSPDYGLPWLSGPFFDRRSCIKPVNVKNFSAIGSIFL
jgi:hypothetical protein